MVQINLAFEATFIFMIASFANYVLGSTAHGKEMAETIDFAEKLVTELWEKGKELSKEVRWISIMCTIKPKKVGRINEV